MNKENSSTVPKPYIFVLIPFDKKFNNSYKFGIKGAAEEVNAYAERVDEQIFTEGILERIFNQINKADVIVADMTDRNPNVFYEVGYAHALGKIVLLLTQKTDDIPFDLQHRQHIVYEGDIEKLKKELVEKLKWAIKESTVRRQNVSEKFLVSIFGTEIPEASMSHNIPILRVEAVPQNIVLPIIIRNGSFETTPNITHIYLFTSKDSNLIPSELDSSRGSWGPIKALEAIKVDAFDDLTKQFRLNATIQALPSGAVEQFEINLMFSGKLKKTNELFRLRIHSSTIIHDFPFRINYEQKSKIK